MKADVLINVLGRMYMDDHLHGTMYPRVNRILDALKDESPQTIYEALTIKDENEYTVLMYASIFTRYTWLRKILELARQVQHDYPKLRQDMFKARTANGESSLILLIEAEKIEAEERNSDIRYGNIKLFLQHGAKIDEKEHGMSAFQYAQDEGVDLTRGKTRTRRTLKKK